MKKNNPVAHIREFTDHQEQRIDNYLFRILKEVPKSRIYRALRSGEVRVNKKRIKPHYRLQLGDQIRLPPFTQAEERPLTISTELLQLLPERIVYEDDQLIVINKPAGLAVHKGSGLTVGLIEAIRHFYRSETIDLVHRIDRETSGCVLLTKKRSLLLALHQQLINHQIEKQYLLLVMGQWDNKITFVDLPLEKNTLQSGERMVVVSPQGKEATTHFQVIHTFNGLATLLAAYPITGRTHQIRVHAASLGHPIAGDTKYGDREFNKKMRDLGLRRLFLHAAGIKFNFLAPNQEFGLCIPLDKALKDVLDSFIDTSLQCR